MRTPKAGSRWLGLLVGGLAALVAGGPLVAAKPAPVKSADVKIEGLGLWTDRTMRQTLLLLLGQQRKATLDASAIEDAAVILYSSLSDDGYLEPTVTAVVRPAAGGPAVPYQLDANLDRPLPRGTEATGVTFVVHKGPRFDLTDVEFRGLTDLTEREARGYFRGEGVLSAFTAERAYSPKRLDRSLNNLLEELRRRGYIEAQARATDLQVNHKSGKVRLVVLVNQGPRWRVASLHYHMVDHSEDPTILMGKRIGLPWSLNWRHDLESDIRRWYFQHGHPDVRIQVAPDAAPPRAGERAVTVTATVTPGALVHLGEIKFKGNLRTRESVLRPLVKAKPGEPLNPLQTQDGQYRISRLGVFKAVDLSYDPPHGDLRDAVYTLQEGKKSDVDLLLGWGSFEELRGGIERHDLDLFGLAHEGTLKFIQSLKSTEGEYDYTVPEVFGTPADGTAKIFGFARHERAFVDEEFGTNLSVATPVTALGANLLTGYTFERLKAENDTLATELTDLTQANATSVAAGLTRDRRDNPLLPRHGYKVFVQVEEASRWLGGQVDFQELQFGGSYHTDLNSSLWLHLGFSHSVITTYGAPKGNQLPPNVLFYPGGEDSIRGYGQGEAAPRDAQGNYLGARAVTQLNVELEQALTSVWSVVAFSDSVGTTATLADYPFDERLYSVGAGLRFRTIIGPIRLEYGRNLNPRRGDPSGTLQFSVGFPF